MAPFPSDGPVLSAWSAAHVDCLVRAPAAARVSCGDRDSHARTRTRFDFRGLSAAPFPCSVFFHYHGLADWHHPDQQLRLLKLLGSASRNSPGRRQVSSAPVAVRITRLLAHGIFKYYFTADTTVHPVDGRNSFMGTGFFSNLGVLRDLGIASLHGGKASASAGWTCARAGTLPHRQRFRTLCGYDARPLCNRIPGIARRT